MIGGLESCWALLQSRWASVSSAKHTVAVSTTRAQLSITIVTGVASLPVALKFLAWLLVAIERAEKALLHGTGTVTSEA